MARSLRRTSVRGLQMATVLLLIFPLLLLVDTRMAVGALVIALVLVYRKISR